MFAILAIAMIKIDKMSRKHMLKPLIYDKGRVRYYMSSEKFKIFLTKKLHLPKHLLEKINLITLNSKHLLHVAIIDKLFCKCIFSKVNS